MRRGLTRECSKNGGRSAGGSVQGGGRHWLWRRDEDVVQAMGQIGGGGRGVREPASGERPPASPWWPTRSLRG